MNCPGCGAGMLPLDFERRLGGQLTLDFCFACQLIWFDPGENTALSPGAVIEVFKALDAHRVDARNTLPSLLNCPRCAARLEMTHDLQHATHFSYYRCPFGHGHLSAFLQFLREKDFIRPISGPELAALKAKIRTIQCSNCGAPVDLEHEIACSFCHTPISILDPDAVANTLRELSAEQAQRGQINVDALADAILQHPRDDTTPTVDSLWVTDLVGVGVGLVAAFMR